MIKTGIFGTHGHMEKFISMLERNGKAKAVVLWDDHKENAEKLSEKTGIPYVEQYTEAIEKYGIEAAIITVPAYMHKEIVLALCKKNIHIFLEKPLCRYVDEAEEMKKAVHESKGKFYMSDPFVRSETIYTKKLIEQGKLGRITSASVRISGKKNWDTFKLEEQQGGIISSIGGHGLHIIHYLFGMPEKVQSSLTNVTGHGVEDNCAVIFTYPDQKVVTLHASWVSGGNTSMMCVYGTKGFVQAQASVHSQDFDSFCWIDGEKGMMDADLPEAPIEHIDYFLKMIEEDLPNEIVGKDDKSTKGMNVDDAYDLVTLINMIYKGV